MLHSFSENTVLVNYFGLSIKVNLDVFYIATNRDGSIYGFNIKPIIKNGRSHWMITKEEEEASDDQVLIILLGTSVFEGDWMNSLYTIR
jgi:hypothetical protein